MTFVVLSGLPGAGKSQIAAALARELGMPIFAKDPVKEALWDMLGPGDIEWSRLLGRAANEVIVSVAAQDAGAVLDSFWRHEWAADALAVLPDPVAEVFCACPRREAHRRYAARSRHAAHMDAPRVGDPDLWGDVRNEPILHDPVTVDTTREVDLGAVATAVRGHAAFQAPVQPGPPALVVLSGLPATGKSTVARAISDAIGAPIVAHDITQAALLRGGLDTRDRSVFPAYELLGTLAREQLALGHPVILDSVLRRTQTREALRASPTSLMCRSSPSSVFVPMRRNTAAASTLETAAFPGGTSWTGPRSGRSGPASSRGRPSGLSSTRLRPWTETWKRPRDTFLTPCTHRVQSEAVKPFR